MKSQQSSLFDCNDCIVHAHENNIESERILKASLPRISKQCKRTLDLLKSGIKLTVRSAMIDYGISSLPRRILDLKQSGYEIKDRLIDGRYKEWFL